MVGLTMVKPSKMDDLGVPKFGTPACTQTSLLCCMRNATVFAGAWYVKKHEQLPGVLKGH